MAFRCDAASSLPPSDSCNKFPARAMVDELDAADTTGGKGSVVLGVEKRGGMVVVALREAGSWADAEVDVFF